MDESAQVHEMSVTTMIGHFRGDAHTAPAKSKSQSLDVPADKVDTEDTGGSRLRLMQLPT